MSYLNCEIDLWEMFEDNDGKDDDFNSMSTRLELFQLWFGFFLL